jgi:hypothetical protein
MALYYIEMNISRVLVGACTTPGCTHVLSKEFQTKPSQSFYGKKTSLCNFANWRGDFTPTKTECIKL